MSYEIHIVPAAERDLRKLSPPLHDRVSARLLSLEVNPRPRGAKKLRGREEYRLRIGDYRVLYAIVDSSHTVTIFAVGHRREVYR